MGLFVWDAKYCLNIEEVDRQHRHLFALFNMLYDAMQEGRATDVIDDVLDQLVYYTDYHFKHEEALFRQYRYPEAAAHTAEHEQLTRQAKELAQRLRGGRSDVSMATLKFLCDWLNHHILGSDKKFAPFLIEKGLR
jgi:hemerythrin-like metal-binding protein